MMMIPMRTLSIRSALAAMFIGLMACIATIGAVGLWSLSAINDNVVVMGTNWLPSVNVTRKLEVDLGQFGISEARHVMSADPEEMKSIEADIAKASSAIAEDLKQYGALVSSGAERDNFKAIQTSIDAYYQLHDKLLSLSLDNKKEEAAALYKGALNDAIKAVNEQVDAAVLMNENGSAESMSASSAAYSRAFIVLASIFTVSLLLGVSSIAFAMLRIIRPISAMTGAMDALSQGTTSVEIPGVGRADEIGSMASAVQVFKDNMIEAEQLRSAQAEAEKRAAEQRKADMRKLANDFQQAVGGIVDAVSNASSHLESAATSLTKTAEMTQSQSGMVAAASEQTSSNVQGVATAAEELSSTVSEISRQVQQSSDIANRAVAQAAATNGRVGELSESANRIGDVIQLINSIAGQTNLLALNATIEAARAGDAGKGFAVVAQEVKALAAQTGKATSEIAQQISAMQQATKEAVDAIHEISTTISQMSEISGAIAAAVEQQGATTKEISRNVSEAAKGTCEVASNITDVSRGASETGSAASQVLASAKTLSGESRTLKDKVGSFLDRVRAA